MTVFLSHLDLPLYVAVLGEVLVKSLDSGGRFKVSEHDDEVTEVERD